MARDIFTDTIALRDSSSNLKALGNVQITVKVTASGTNATIYQSRTGAAQGPAPQSGATGTNPFTTGVSGLVMFWVDPGEYTVEVHDLNAPARIGDFNIGYNALPAAVGGIAGTLIAADGGVVFNALDAVTKRQFPPLGTVIEWWRPSTTYNPGTGAGGVPLGWEICDGRSIASINHDFGGGSAVVLPDLRNNFILGADATKANDTAVTAGEAVTSGPGIGAAGGVNVRDLSHTHTVSSHSHGGSTGATATGSTGAGDHSHTVSGGTSLDTKSVGNNNSGLVNEITTDNPNHTHPVVGATNTTGTHAHFVASHAHTITAEAPSTNAQLTTAIDIRPRYVGLLRLMKVKRN